MKRAYTEQDFGPQNVELVREALVESKKRPRYLLSPDDPRQRMLDNPPSDLELSPAPDEKAARKTEQHERNEQIEYFDRVRECLDAHGRSLPHRPGADLIHAIGNENAAGPAMGAQRKRMGVKKGMPDICVPVPRGQFCGLYIELKRCDGVPSDVREEQRDVHSQLSDAGWSVVVAFGWRRAFSVTAEYLGWTGHPLYSKG